MDDAGYPDLSWIQIMPWTILARDVFLADVVQQMHTTTPTSLPDGAPALLILASRTIADYAVE